MVAKASILSYLNLPLLLVNNNSFRMHDGVTMFTPIEGYVMKFKKVNEEIDPEREPSYVKAFVNIFHSPQIPEPQDLTPQEAFELFSSSDLDQFEIPFVMGKFVDVVTDKNSENAMKFDVTVSSKFLEKYLIVDREGVHCRLLMAKICEAINQMHSISMNYWEAILLNRRRMGTKPEAQELVLFKRSTSMVQEEYEEPKTSGEVTKPMVIVEDDPPIGESESTEGEIMNGYYDIVNDVYSIEQNERVRMRIIDGEKLEIRIKVESFQGLRLEMSRSRVHLRNRHQSIVDFHHCIPIDKKRVITKVFETKNLLEILAPIHIPQVEA
ncbi:hypothetical protein PENTCL1PPCAC_2178 [Pristionchus entomophagus]|uniref:PIH1 N-terminal domain-containing protein n=1 Tax=Pristionchus entomophagus TaxID=358040 RepID=A0AAV5SCT1_9BILA|nr:hypothetical protein PENTCL1PPCAC_2178 [Pristionchus entomophagus]